MSRHDALVDAFRSAVDPEARSDAVRQLTVGSQLTCSREVVRTLVDALNDEDPVVKEWAAVALWRFPDNTGHATITYSDMHGPR